MRKSLLTTLVIGAGVLSSVAMADVKLPAIISDNMVVQAGKPLAIWGTADAGEKVSVTLGKDTQNTTAAADGKWSVKLSPVQAGDAGELTVKGNNALTVKNILAGSVWVCSGQSNMQFGLGGAHNAATEIPAANYPNIRLFTVPNTTAFEPQSDCLGKWVVCTPKTVPSFSAVAYFFGRDLHVATGLPVGLIHSSWGGTPAQAWTSLDGLDKDPELSKAFVTGFRTLKQNMPQELEKYRTIALSKYEEALKKWNADAAKAKADGQTPARAPQKPNLPDRNSGTPSVLYNAMIAPIIPFTLDGAIWYQGEANAGQPAQYRTLFPRMITDWREKWGQGDFAFYFVQLANYQAAQQQPSEGGWAFLREAQTMTLKLPNTGMAVIIDIGQAENIHPKDKSDVGHRLALWALHDVFKKDVVYSGPLYDSMKVDGNKIRLTFKHVDGGLTIGVAPATQPSVAAAPPLSELKGFAIAGTDQKWVWAKAQIDGETVLVWSDEVAAPTAVRYGWANNPFVNLYNKAGLPASPFRTDTMAK